jgi:hypothetical protein
MARRSGLVALVSLLWLATEARAQILYFPNGGFIPPTVPAVAVGGSGFGIAFQRGRFGASFFLGTPATLVPNPAYNPFFPNPNPFNPFPSPFGYTAVVPVAAPGIVDTRINVQVINPPGGAMGPQLIQPLGVGGPRILIAGNRGQDPDTVGVDLDLKPDPPKPVVKKPEPELPRKPEPKPEPQKPLPPQEKPADENARLVGLGLGAFSVGQYGLAAFRFRQATEIEPKLAPAYFLLGQAEIAVGNYKDAYKAIEAGIRRDPKWPRSDFKPRVELYKGIEADMDAHLAHVQKAREASPKNATYLFLNAYLLWFDGRRGDAVPLFRQARALSADKTIIDAFLRAEELAAK